MGRILIGGLVVAIIAIIAGYVISVKDEAARKVQESKIVELQGQLQKLQDENIAHLVRFIRQSERGFPRLAKGREWTETILPKSNCI